MPALAAYRSFITRAGFIFWEVLLSFCWWNCSHKTANWGRRSAFNHMLLTSHPGNAPPQLHHWISFLVHLSKSFKKWWNWVSASDTFSLCPYPPVCISSGSYFTHPCTKTQQSGHIHSFGLFTFKCWVYLFLKVLMNMGYMICLFVVYK